MKHIRDDLYSILGLPNFASVEEVKKAYRKLAWENHPDRGGSLERMKLLNSAYDLLIKSKSQYDEALRQKLEPAVKIVWEFKTWYGSATSTTSSGYGF